MREVVLDIGVQLVLYLRMQHSPAYSRRSTDLFIYSSISTAREIRDNKKQDEPFSLCERSCKEKTEHERKGTEHAHVQQLWRLKSTEIRTHLLRLVSYSMLCRIVD